MVVRVLSWNKHYGSHPLTLQSQRPAFFEGYATLVPIQNGQPARTNAIATCAPQCNRALDLEGLETAFDEWTVIPL